MFTFLFEPHVCNKVQKFLPSILKRMKGSRQTGYDDWRIGSYQELRGLQRMGVGVILQEETTQCGLCVCDTQLANV